MVEVVVVSAVSVLLPALVVVAVGVVLAAAQAPLFSIGLRGTEMKKAWIENGKVRDVCHGKPEEVYHPTVAAFYTATVPNGAENGDSWDGTTLTKKVIVTDLPPVVVPPVIKLSPIDFKLLLTSAERKAAKVARKTDPTVDDFYDLLDDQRLKEVNLSLKSNQDALSYFVSIGILTPARRAEILTGVVA